MRNWKALHLLCYNNYSNVSIKKLDNSKECITFMVLSIDQGKIYNKIAYIEICSTTLQLMGNL